MLKIKETAFNQYTLALIVIFAINGFFKWHFFSGLVMADDFSYGVYSYSLFRLPLPWNMDMDFRTLRFALLLPVALLFRFLPPTEFVAVLYPMILSFGSILLGYLIGKKLYGPVAGVFTAFVIATFPADIRYGTMLLPDIVVPFYLGLAVWAFINAETGSGYRVKLWYLLLGFSVFLAFNARENSYYFLLFFVPFVFSIKRWKNGFYLIAPGFAIPVLLLYTIYFFKSGDFLYNLHLAQKTRDPLIASGYIPDNSLNWKQFFYFMFPGFFADITGKPGFISETFGFSFVVGVPCLFYTTIKSLIKRNWKLLIAPWWFLIGYLYLEFGTLSFEHYQMMKKLPRFLLVVTPALALGYGVVLSDITGFTTIKTGKVTKWVLRVISGFVIIAVVFLQIFTLLEVLPPQKASFDANMAKFRWGYYEVLKDLPRESVYTTGGWWFNKLSFYFLPDLRFADTSWRRSDMLLNLLKVEKPSELAGTYVIIDHSHFTGENDLGIMHSYDSFGSYVQVPPKEWELLGINHGVEIYSVPEDWRYIEPDGQELALNSLLRSIKIGDGMLFIYSLHPDFLSSLNETQANNLIKILLSKNNPGRAELLKSRLEYKKHNGKWKILFKLN